MKRLIKVMVLAAMAAFSPLAFGHGGGGGGHGGGYHGGGHGYYGGGYGYYGGFYGYPSFGFGYGYGYPGFGYAYGDPAYGYGYYGARRGYYGRRPYYRSRGGEPVYAGRSVGAEVQKALARRGYYRSRIDGQFGPQTRQAIRHYQRERGLAVTGAVDRSLLRSLGI